MKEVIVQMHEDESLVKYIFKTSEMPELIASQCEAGNYQPTVIDDEGKEVENPISSTQFAWERIRQFALNDLANYRRKKKIEEATKDITVELPEVKGLL